MYDVLYIGMTLVVLIAIFVLIFRFERKPKTIEQEPEISHTELKECICAALFGDETKQYHCGHIDSAQFSLLIYGVNVPVHGHLHCPDCSMEDIANIVVRCARCGKPIFPNEAVAVYDILERVKVTTQGRTDTMIHAEHLDLAIAFHVDPQRVLGCSDKDCCTVGYHDLWYWDGTTVWPNLELALVEEVHTENGWPTDEHVH